MVTEATFKKIALAFPDVSERPHFEKIAFSSGKKIFATLSPGKNIACVKLSPVEQSVFSLVNTEWIYPVPNKWGLQGWTNINLLKISSGLCRDILKTAYAESQTQKPKIKK